MLFKVVTYFFLLFLQNETTRKFEMRHVALMMFPLSVADVENFREHDLEARHC